MPRLLVLCLLLGFSGFMAYSQTGPAGIGNANGANGQPALEMWYDATDLTLNNNDLVSAWPDKSGNGRNLSQTGTARPTYKNATDANYSFPSVRFDGVDDFLSIDGDVFVNSDYTFILVGTRRAGGRQIILGGTSGNSNQNFHPYFNGGSTINSHHWGNDHNGSYTGGDGSTVNGTTPDFGVFSFRLNSSLSSANRTIFQNGTQVSSRDNNQQLSTYPGAAIGRLGVFSEFSEIDVAEVIVFSEALNEAELATINNYLASKYGLAMDANDFYAGDTPANGDFDQQVTGFGRLAGSVTAMEASIAGFTIEANSSLNTDGEFVLIGTDNTTNGVSTSDLGTGVAARWAKVWYLDKTSSDGISANVIFDIQDGIGGEYPAGDKDNYVLLRENAGLYEIVPLNDTDKTVIGSEIRFAVSDANLADGTYTLGTIDVANSPLDGVANQTWYSYKTGDWSDPLTWTLDGSGLLRQPASGGMPDATDNVVILPGKTVLMDINDAVAGSLEVSGELDLAATSGHQFNTILGNGTILMSGAAGIDNFPEGDATDFADDFIGGTVEYYGSGLSLDKDRTYNNLVLNLDDATSELVLLANLTLNGDLTLTRGQFQINDNTATEILTLEVSGDALVDANASIAVGEGNTIGSYSIPGTMPGNGNYHDIYHQVIFGGDFTNLGTVRFTNQTAPVYNQFTSSGAATVIFTNASNNIASLFGTTDFYNLIVDKGTDQTYELELNADNTSNFSLYGPNSVGRVSSGAFTAADPEVRKALWIYNGTLHLTGNLEIPSLTEGSEAGGNGDYPIGANGALWIDSPNVTVYTTANDNTQIPAGATGVNTGGSNQALSLYGRFRITDGYFGTRRSAGFIFWNAAAGEVLIEGGTINVSQFRSAGGAAGTNSYTQTGGTVIVRASEGQAGETDGTYALFCLHLTESVFNMSGGTLQVYGDTGNGSFFVNSAEGNYSVTGGDVIVENRNGNNAVISSTAPIWNLTLEKDQAGDADEIDFITYTSGGATITNPTLRVLNDFVIGNDVIFDHNGNNVEVGSDFVVSAGAEYVFDEAKHNTLTLNGIDNARMALLNISGGGNPGDQQQFYNLTINKPHGKVVSLESSKTGGNLNNWQNNLFRVDGESFKVLSGTLDQGVHSVLANCDTLVNYDVLTVYNVANGGVGGANDVDANANGNNDQLKMAANQGTPTDIVVLTADTAVIGNLKYYMQSNVVTLETDLTIQFLEYSNGRLDIGENNLRVLYFNEAPGQGFQSTPSVNHMIVTGGRASDGGVSFYVDGNDNLTYPFGLGLTGSEPSSKYTPATVNISNFSDDGFITIRPVDGILGTTLESGGDILSYYWRVDYEGFTIEPTVEYTFNYYDDDDDDNSEGNFVAGKVLENNPFTRSYEDDTVPENEGVNTTNNTITFNGPSDTGFTLEEASYTAGEPGRFVGAPTVFYNTNTGIATWNTGSKWTSNQDGTDDGINASPGDGDVVIMQSYGNGNQDHWVYVNINISIARLTFDNSNGGWLPRLWVTKRNSTLDLGTVDGTGDIYLEATSTQQPEFSDDTDIGGFARNVESVFTYKIDTDNATVLLPSQFSEYPRLRIEAGDGGGDDDNRMLVTSVPITINGDVRMDRSSRFRINHDVTIKDDLRITWQANRCTFEIGDNQEVTVTVEGDLRLEDGDGNDDSRLVVKNDNQSGYVHRLRVGGNVEIESVNTGSSVFDLYNGAAPNNNAVLEFINEGQVTFTNASTIIPDLYRMEMNKGNSVASQMQIDSDFDLSGPTDGVGVAKALELLNGRLILNNAGIDINLSTGDDDFIIPASSGLTITQGQTNVSGDDSGIFLDGALVINGGTLNMDDAVGNGNNYIEYSASGAASINVSSGNLTVGSQVRGNLVTTAGILNYTQTGGTVIIAKNAAPQASRGVFEVKNTGSNFTYTGGSLTLVRQNTTSPSVAALRILPSTYNVTETIFIGSTDTPTSQNNFGINANVPLAGLTINGTNSPTAVIQVNPLQLTGNLLISSGATLNANSVGLSLFDNFTNNGSFVANGNTTSFVGTGSQFLSGSSTTTFHNLTKTNDAVLEINNGITVNNLLRHEEGTINDNGNTIDLKGNAVLEGDHASSGGNGLQFSGTVQQQLLRVNVGTSTLGVVTITNPAGVIIPESNGYDFNIEGDLQMNGGVFNIGSSSVTLGQNADVTTSSSFSVTNMVKTNSSFTDNGLSKVFSAGFSTPFTFPIGELDYTPVTVDFSIAGGTSGSSVGSISARPANEYHPTVDDGDDVLGSDIDNVLQYYWTLKSSGLTSFTADINFEYNQSKVSTAESGYDEADYIAARILAFDNPTNDINKYTVSDVDEINNIISFNAVDVFNAVGSNGIAGDYFAGIDEAIPNNVATYTSTGTGGDVTNDATYIETLPTDGVAPSGAILIVSSGTTVDFNANNVRLYKTVIENGAILNVEGTDGHRLGVLEGTGTLKITSNTNNASLPAADYGEFFSCSGGGLEYAGTGSYNILAGISSLKTLTLSGSGDRNFPNTNIYVCEDLIIQGTNVVLASNRRLDIINDLVIESGAFNLASGASSRVFVERNVQIDGGALEGSSSGGIGILGNLIINGGIYNFGTGSHFIVLRQDLNFISGSINSQTARVLANSDSFVQNFIGDFTGANALNKLELNNRTGNNDFILDGTLEITGELTLTDGNLITNGNEVQFGNAATVSPASGRSNSYIEGRATKVINSAGGSFTFPIGDEFRWRPATVSNVSTGGLTWGAEFFSANPTSHPTVDNLSPTDVANIATVSNNEYWVISDGNGAPSGVTANIGLSWGSESDVSPNSSERSELEVMAWNDGASTWDNYGGTSFSGGNTQSQGSFVSASMLSFSENIVTLGSGDASNPLPVELTLFDAHLSGNQVDLVWETATELNNDFFEVQRSIDGNNFETIEIISGAGTTKETQNYRTVDYQPLAGTSYYRLRQVDFNGDYEFSKVVTVNNNGQVNVSLYPNPTSKEEVYVRVSSFNYNSPIHIAIWDMKGVSHYSGILTLEQLQKPLSISSNMLSGIYIVEVTQGNVSQKVRLMIE